MNATDIPVHHYEDAKIMDVHDMSRAELMSEVVRLREQQSRMIDFCVEAETLLRQYEKRDQ